MLLQFLAVLLLTVLNGLFVMAEMAVVSVRKSRLKELSDQGDQRAAIALTLAEQPHNFLSTVQTGITLVNVLTAAVGGATLADSLTPYIAVLPLIGAHAAVLSLAIVVVAITYLTLVIGELVPKRLALSYAEAIALRTARPLRAVLVAARPVIILLSRSSDVALRILGIKQTKETPVTEEEIKILLEHGEQAGVFEEEEKEMIERVFRLGDRRVDQLMTHRKDVIWLDINEGQQTVWTLLSENTHTYYPLCNGDTDHVVGIVAIKDLCLQLVRSEPFNLTGVMRKPLYVPGTITALRVLDRFRESQSHIALVVNEYGSLEGLVTVTDIVEAVVGQLPAPGEELEPMVVEREDGSLLIDGSLPFDEFEDLLNMQGMDETEDERGEYKTLAGFIINHLGRFPSIGERFEWRNHLLEVVDMDGHRVDRVLVTPIDRKDDLASGEESAESGDG